LNFSTLLIFFIPTFLIISSVFEDQGEIVPALGPTINEKGSSEILAARIFFH
jgi:hypothetical protein